MQDFRNRSSGRSTAERFRQAYYSSALQGDDYGDDMEVELAEPWRRVAAFALNVVLMFVFALGTGFILGFAGSAVGRNFMDGSNNAVVGLVVMLVYGIGQTMMMVKTGQSLGKRIMHIRVISDDGGPIGLLKGVLLREWVVFFVLQIVFGLVPLLGGLLALILLAASIIMMFMDPEGRRTPQDWLANTLVIRA
ncbi:RDD family protein [Eikenella sp. S3360]|uniref:RDD family protein n=1 Tax=Eikenella glucosivorans TaxID=2766967 RepID=A0ABS0NBU5_9NEIS|nr:RDD family protein [Eikenella glucosivorans]MBH5329724.1 RDD family protein [Eikenella glucosivorans]